MIRAIGVDLSYYDLSFDPARATIPISFAILRAGYGGKDGGVWRDPAFEKLLPGVEKVPIRGAYWYYSTYSPWMQQADFFLETVQDKGFQFYALDFESAYNQLTITSSQNADFWMQYVAQKTKKPVVFYTNPSLYDVYGWHYCSKWPLWLAQYWNEPSPNKAPGMPRTRQAGDWLIYQWACERNFPGHAQEYGAGGNSIDLNVFNGAVGDMIAWLKGDYTPTIPVTTKTVKIAAWPWLNVRSGAGISYSKVKTLLRGAVVQITEIDLVGADRWAKLASGEGWIALLYNGQTLAVEV